MKIAVLIIVTLFVCCESHKTSINSDKSNGDTIVSSVLLPVELSGTDYNMKDYYIVTKEDTSNFICSISEHKSTGEILLKVDILNTYIRNRSEKYNIADSAAIDSNLDIYQLNYLNYDQQFRELNILFRTISKEYDFKKITGILYNLEINKQLSHELSYLYKKKYGENHKNIKNRVIVDLVKQSQFIQRLNQILKEFNKVALEITIDGLVYKYNKESIDFDGTIIFSLGEYKKIK